MSSVYVIEGRQTGQVKIGVASNVKARLESMQSGSPVDLWLRFSMKMKDSASAVAVELAVHNRLSAHRQRGEWFMVDWEAARDAIVNIAACMPAVNDGEPRSTQWRDGRSPHSIAVRKFGGVRRLSRATGINKSLISRWGKNGGSIPSHHARTIFHSAKREGIDITLRELTLGLPA